MGVLHLCSSVERFCVTDKEKKCSVFKCNRSFDGRINRKFIRVTNRFALCNFAVTYSLHSILRSHFCLSSPNIVKA